MENNFDFDYTGFDPDKQYKIANERAGMSNAEMLQRASAAANGRENYLKDPRCKENAKRMGSNQGKINVESGHLDRVRDTKKSGKASGNVIRTCDRCAKTLKGNAAYNNHMAYHQSYDHISSLLNETFSIKELKSILVQQLHNTSSQAFKKAMSFAKDPYYATKIYEGTHGSNTDVSIYKKILPGQKDLVY